jgi:hypothetical protein
MQVAGKVLKITASLAEDNVDGAIDETIGLGMEVLTGSLAGDAIKYSKKVGNITNTSEEVINETVLNGTGSVINKVSDKIRSIKNDDEER